jgi:hypothetical protein
MVSYQAREANFLSLLAKDSSVFRRLPVFITNYQKLRISIILLIVLTSLLFYVLSALASVTIPAQNNLNTAGFLFGQKHYYSVIFRGNTEAIVYARMVVTNLESSPLREISFEMPKVTPTEMVAFQQKSSDYYGSDYYNYNNNVSQYQKIHHTQSLRGYRLPLPYSIATNQSSTILIAYAAKGYVKESFGLYSFDFETLKVPSRVEEVRVAVDVDSDLLLKGKRSEVNYSTNELKSLGAPSAISASGADFGRVSNNIGYSGSLVKDARNLAPSESFIVKGEYAKSWSRLYLNSIVTTLVIIVVILLGLFYLNKFFRRRQARLKEESNEVPASKVPEGELKSEGLISRLNKPVSFSLLPILIGLISAALVIGLTFSLRYLGEVLRYFSYSFYDQTLMIIILITFMLLYALIIFGPAVALGLKYGGKFSLIAVVSEFGWFLLFLILYLFLYAGLNFGSNPSYAPFY